MRHNIQNTGRSPQNKKKVKDLGIIMSAGLSYKGQNKENNVKFSKMTVDNESFRNKRNNPCVNTFKSLVFSLEIPLKVDSIIIGGQDSRAEKMETV